MKKSDFLNEILKISRAASERKRKNRETQISSNIDAGYKRMKEIIIKQAKKGIYWASMSVKCEYSSEVADGIVEKFKQDGFDGKVKSTVFHSDELSSTIVEVYWSMLDNG